MKPIEKKEPYIFYHSSSHDRAISECSNWIRCSNERYREFLEQGYDREHELMWQLRIEIKRNRRILLALHESHFRGNEDIPVRVRNIVLEALEANDTFAGSGFIEELSAIKLKKGTISIRLKSNCFNLHCYLNDETGEIDVREEFYNKDWSIYTI